jgi:hypothetical protein
MTAISPRAASAPAVRQLIADGHPPALARIFAARGISDGSQMDTTFASLLPFDHARRGY